MPHHGIKLFRHQGRYYAFRHEHSFDHENLGHLTRRLFLEDGQDIDVWLEQTYDYISFVGQNVEDKVIEIRENPIPLEEVLVLERLLLMLPSPLPRLNRFYPDYTFTIDLDDALFTMNHNLHWPLQNPPLYSTRNDLADRLVAEEMRFMLGPDLTMWHVFHEVLLAHLPTDLAERNMVLEGCHIRHCVPHITIDAAPHKTFRAMMACEVITSHFDELVQFGRRWRPYGFVFRELAYALISAAAGEAELVSFKPQRDDPRRCNDRMCTERHLHSMYTHGYLSEEWVGDLAPLPSFGSPAHLPGIEPGAAPIVTIYWLRENMLVSLVDVADGPAMTRAMRWGLDTNSASNFQMIVLSLFDVVFAEVFRPKGDGKDKMPTVRIASALPLSPLRETLCYPTHTNQRTSRNEWYHPPGCMAATSYVRTIKQVYEYFPGIAAMVNFFDAAAGRAAGLSSPRRLPQELYDKIVQHTPDDDWRCCSEAFPIFRQSCLTTYRLGNGMALTGGPWTVTTRNGVSVIGFDFTNMETGERISAVRVPSHVMTTRLNWMPMTASSLNRRVLVVDACLQFLPIWDEDESESEIGTLPNICRILRERARLQRSRDAQLVEVE